VPHQAERRRFADAASTTRSGGERHQREHAPPPIDDLVAPRSNGTARQQPHPPAWRGPWLSCLSTRLLSGVCRVRPAAGGVLARPRSSATRARCGLAIHPAVLRHPRAIGRLPGPAGGRRRFSLVRVAPQLLRRTRAPGGHRLRARWPDFAPWCINSGPKCRSSRCSQGAEQCRRARSNAGGRGVMLGAAPAAGWSTGPDGQGLAPALPSSSLPASARDGHSAAGRDLFDS
jgi:hypothetical protein